MTEILMIPTKNPKDLGENTVIAVMHFWTNHHSCQCWVTKRVFIELYEKMTELLKEIDLVEVKE